MNIYKLLKNFNILKISSISKIINISDNTSNIKPYSLFIAKKGFKYDSHKDVRKVALQGATAIILENKDFFQDLKDIDVTVALTNNSRKSEAIISSRFYNDPSSEMEVIGITGTNGKTSTSYILAQFYELLDKNVGVIGTLGYKYKGYKFGEGNTTPGAIEWFQLLREMKDLGAEVITAEISSHALDQYRVYGTKFAGGIFTNLTQDHLDYHKNLDDYFFAKRKLVDLVLERNPDGIFVTNIDDNYGRELYQIYKDKIRIITYGYSEDADFRILDTRLTFNGQHFIASYRGEHLNIFTNLLGDFNVYNLSAAISYLIGKGYHPSCIVELAKHIKPIKGRFETIETDFLVVNDYAHTPDALEKVLKSIKKLKPRRIITVFGAGGNRDKSKRPKMGRIVEEFSDIVIITSDNPRFEDPEDIIKDIKSGMKLEKKTFVITDRELAIEKAICLAQKKDVVLIAGKGHETYQIIRDKIYPFDDIEVAKKYLKKLGYTINV